MPDVPTWMLGRDISGVVITGATVGADGTLTDATGAGSQPLGGKWEEIDLDYEAVHENIKAGDARRQNNVIVEDGWRIRMSQILQKAKRAGAGATDEANPLAHIINAYDYFKVVGTRGGKTWTGYFTKGTYGEGWRSGKSLGIITGVPCDPNTGQVTYT